jgi:putative sterol carrier protein
MSLPEFNSVAYYEAVAASLNTDPIWLDMAKPITYTMVFCYEHPVDRNFLVRFHEGRITEVREVAEPRGETVDFVITGKPESWRGVIHGDIKPNAAMATGKLKVDGKQTVLLRHMKKFAYMINKMTQIDASYG